MRKQIEINERDLKSLMIKLCELGETMGYNPDEFSIMLSMAAKYLSDTQGIEVHSERKTNA